MKRKIPHVLGLTAFFATTFFMPFAAQAVMSGISLRTNIPTTSTSTLTISPDFDGSGDYVDILFSANATGTIKVIIDTNENSAFDPVDWSTFNPGDSEKDWSERRWVASGDSGSIRWGGRDMHWNALSNGTYAVKLIYDPDGDFSTTSGQEVDTSMTVSVSTAHISGRVTNAGGTVGLENVKVFCGGPSGGSEGITDSNGDYTVSGLVKGSSYNVDVNASKVPGSTNYTNAEYMVNNQHAQVTARSTSTADNTGINFLLDEALQITGTITIPSTFTGRKSLWDPNVTENSLWIRINAWNTQGAGRGWSGAEITTGNNSTTYKINLPPGNYKIRAESDGYVSQTQAPGDLSTSTSPLSQNMSLTQAKKVYGSVSIPQASSTQKNIQVNAEPVDSSRRNDFDNYAGGWGNISPNSTGGGTTVNSSGYFEISSILPGTYNVTVRVDGYVSHTFENITISENDSDINLTTSGAVALGGGGTISGTITIQGDTTDFQRFGGDNATEFNIWVNCFNPSNPVDGWGGTNAKIVKGSNKSGTFTIGGLPAGTYEVNAWFAEGYEPVHQTGQPIFPVVTITSDGSGSADLTFAPWSGVIRGTVTAKSTGQEITSGNVLVKVMKADWFGGGDGGGSMGKYKRGTMGKPGSGIDMSDDGGGGMWFKPLADRTDANGAYEISGLGTGKYIVVVNEYQAQSLGDTTWQTNPENDFAASGTYGRFMSVISVSNGSITTKDIALYPGYSITGKLAIDPTDPIYNDPNCTTHTLLTLDKLNGLMLTAFPLKGKMMGGAMMSQYRQAASIQGNDLLFSIDGLAPGTYSITPDKWLGDGGCGLSNTNGDRENLFGAESRMVTISSSDVDLTSSPVMLFDGYDVNGTVTLPETPDTGFFFVGINLDPAGGGEPLFKNLKTSDFSGNPLTAKFQLLHVSPGKYMARGFSPNYTEPATEVEVVGSDLSGVSLSFTKGASIKGRLVDAETGSGVTSGVSVFCEATPWVPGSYRETRNDDWSKSKIDSNGNFTLANLPAGTYIVGVRSHGGGSRTGSSVNYAGAKLANIIVSDDASSDNQEVDVGTIRLNRAITIKGTVTDSNGNPLGNIPVFAGPENRHSNAGEGNATTQVDGTYTLYISPSTTYYEVCASEHPDFMEFLTPEWGEVCKRNVEKGSENVNFGLNRATSSISGTLSLQVSPTDSTAGSLKFSIPMDFGSEMSNFPVAFILLQNQSQVYSDPMDGIDGISSPSTTSTTSYEIDGLVPGTYTIKVFCGGYGTRVIKDVLIDSGTELDIGLYEGVKVSGTVRKEDGSNFTTSEVNIVAAFDPTGNITFGKLTSNSSTREVTAYSVSGLQVGIAYKLAFLYVGNDGPEGPVMMAGTVTPATDDDITNNVSIDAEEAFKPDFLPQISRSSSGGTFNISLFGTQFLTDDDAGDIFTLNSGQGSGTFSKQILSDDKREITCLYTPGSGDTTFGFNLTVHYGNDNTELSPKPSFGPYNTSMGQANKETLNALTGGSATMGGGDASGMSFSEGDIKDGNGDGKETLDITSSDDLAGASQAFNLSVYGVPHSPNSDGLSSISALPSGMTKVSDYYLFSGVSLNTNGSAKVTLQYDQALTSGGETNLHIYYSTNGGTSWTLLSSSGSSSIAGTGIQSVDTDSNTISASTTSTDDTTYVVAQGALDTVTTPGIQGAGVAILITLVVGMAFYKKERMA